MKALVVSILVNGIQEGFLQYQECTWTDSQGSTWTDYVWMICRDLIDAKLFPEDAKWSVEFDAKQYVKSQGSEYTYEIKVVTLPLE